MIETGAHPWDWAAPLVIVEEGRRPLHDGKRGSESSTGHPPSPRTELIHDELLRRLQTREIDAETDEQADAE